MKTILFHLRRLFRLAVILLIGALLIGTLVHILYRPMYAVYLDGELIGYTEKKSKLQEKINEYVKNGNGNEVAFYELDSMPTYEICYSKKNIVANENKVFDAVVAKGTAYYKQYAIVVNKQEEYYVATYEEAESVVKELKQKKSTNANNISYKVTYAENKQEETASNKIVSSLYKKPKTKKEEKTKTSKTTSRHKDIKEDDEVDKKTVKKYSKKVVPAGKLSSSGFMFPVAGCTVKDITTKTYPSYRGHTGVDVNSQRSKGRLIIAAKAGKVIESKAKKSGGSYYSYGEYVKIRHNDGTITLYAHMAPGSRAVSKGDIVKQGQVIGKMGQTGNASGIHLHFEVRKNGRAVNPFNYLY